LFTVERVKYLRQNVQLVVIVLGCVGQFHSNVEFLVLIESQARCERSLELLREKSLYDEDVVELHTRDAAQALPLNLQLGRIALAVFRDKHVAAHLEVQRPHVRLVAVLLNRSLAITRGFSPPPVRKSRS
jgi:hypothetical protein